MKIKKGDHVEVLAGKEKGKRGDVIRVLPTDQTVIVAGVNVAKKHKKATSATTQAGIIDKDMPMALSNVALICSKDGPTRAGFAFDNNGEKYRICRKCGGKL
ncbi:MAG: 50S ribosomal protein L24 [Firmicutes bacterium]|jgi:large subunit ribosomal protein L24|nr:50S ribosomal protein L24 [Bacillota bacterium]